MPRHDPELPEPVGAGAAATPLPGAPRRRERELRQTPAASRTASRQVSTLPASRRTPSRLPSELVVGIVLVLIAATAAVLLLLGILRVAVTG